MCSSPAAVVDEGDVAALANDEVIGLIAAAVEQATHKGILPWPTKDATRVAAA